MPTEFPPEMLARLACVMEPFQLAEFIDACTAAREAGNGYASVTVIFSNSKLSEIEGRFTLKPRRDQSVLLRGG